MSEGPTALETATTRELIDELFSRHEHAIFAGKPLIENSVVDQRTKGSDSMCIGFCYCLADDLREIRRTHKE